MFKVQVWFFVALFAHIVAFHLLAWWLLRYFGNNWVTWIVSACFMTIGQAQAGWLQHDFGHHTVFNNTKLNHFFHDVTIGLMKVPFSLYTGSSVLYYNCCRVFQASGGITGIFNIMLNPMW